MLPDMYGLTDALQKQKERTGIYLPYPLREFFGLAELITIPDSQHTGESPGRIPCGSRRGMPHCHL